MVVQFLLDISNSLLIQWLKGIGSTFLNLNVSYTTFYVVTHVVEFNSSNVAALTAKFRSDASTNSQIYLETTWVNNNSHGYAQYPVQLHMFGI